MIDFQATLAVGQGSGDNDLSSNHPNTNQRLTVQITHLNSVVMPDE